MERKTYLERYRVIGDAHGVPIELSSSVAGVTYKAEDIDTGEPVAVELVRSEMVGPGALEQLEGDAPKAHQLVHPNIARVHDVGLDGEHVVYVREYLEGSTLQEWVQSHGPLPLGAVLRIASQVVSALAAASFHSLRHRAIQPANLMIVPGQTPEGEWPLVKVLNYGAPPPSFQRAGFTTVGVGNSAQFASPEQIVGGNVDFRSEIYSLGCTLWFLLTGAPPATDVAVARFSGVPKAVRKLIAQMIAVDADGRPKDPTLLQEQIRECLARVDQREAIGRRFGIPLISGRRATAIGPVAAAAVAPAPAPVVAAVAPTPLAEVTPPVTAPADTSAAPSITHLPRRASAWKPLALAALLMALGALGALLATNRISAGRLVGGSDPSGPIGVPVGVPEASTVTTVANTNTAPRVAPATSIAPQVASNTTAPVAVPTLSAAPATGPAVTETAAANTTTAAPSVSQSPGWTSSIVSADGGAPATAQPAAQASAPASSEPPTVVATNTTPPAPQPAEPASPAEGPVDAAAPQQAASQPSSAARAPEATAAKPATSQRKTASAAAPAASPAKTAKSAAKASKDKPKREEQPRIAQRVPDDAGLPPVPNGSRRARYLGTRPDGSMVFSLPSSEEVFVPPPRGAYVPNRSSRRPARALPVDPPRAVVIAPDQDLPDAEELKEEELADEDE